MDETGPFLVSTGEDEQSWVIPSEPFIYTGNEMINKLLMLWRWEDALDWFEFTELVFYSA